MRIEDQILLEENELKPNRYVSSAMLWSLAVIVFIQMLNELGIFHVADTRMRLCVAFVASCSLLTQVVGRVRRISANPHSKYLVLGFVLLETLAITTALGQWAELMFVIPILLALQYHTRRMTWYALGGTAIIALIANPMAVYFSLPQLDYYQYLINTIGYRVDALSLIPDFDKGYYMFGVFKYVGVPRSLVIICLGVIALYITKLVSGNIQSRIDATYYSITDIMTGIYNRFSFSSKVDELEQTRPSGLICIYADADGLHELNNEFGHQAGDDLLINCARQMNTTFGELTYRLGGDEFLSFVENGDPEQVACDIRRITGAMAGLGYHMSLGYSCLQPGQSIDDLVKSAEAAMFQAKHEFYIRSGKDRRKRRG